MKSSDTTTIASTIVPATPATASLLFVSPDQVQSVSLVEGDSLIVGRVAPADLVLSHASVSRQHARFTLSEGVVEVADAGSKNGVSVNGAIVKSARVGSGDCVRLGDVEVWIGQDARLRSPQQPLLGARRFAQRVDEELERTRYSGRPIHVLVLLRAPSVEENAWLSRILPGLRPVDRVSEHAPHLLLCLLVERDAQEACVVAEVLRQLADVPTRAALVTAPPGPMNAEALIAVAIDSAQRADVSERVQPVQHLASERSAEAPVIVSALTMRLFELATRTAHVDIPLLISGETGAGKEVIARAFHERSRRAGQPFCEVNCAAIAPTLLESLLFGHEKGAFTGADKRSLGLFEQAQGGTIFLDEVGELPAPAQSALLRVLESKRIRRLGAAQEIPVDVRVIAATHRTLREMVAKGEFREDLLYRLEGLSVRVPPLRERTEEIGPLSDHFLSVATGKWNTSARKISDAARQALLRYTWPGNVRQLRNAIERAAAVCASGQIELDDLPEYLFEVGHSDVASLIAAPSTGSAGASLVDDVREFEIAKIRDALEQANGNRSQAARALGIPRRTLGGKIKDLGLE